MRSRDRAIAKTGLLTQDNDVDVDVDVDEKEKEKDKINGVGGDGRGRGISGSLNDEDCGHTSIADENISPTKHASMQHTFITSASHQIHAFH